MLPPDARITLLNASLSDRDRAEALARLVEVRGIATGIPEPARNVFDKDVLGAAMQLVTHSSDWSARVRVMYLLGSANDTAVVSLLRQVISEDPDPLMRHLAIQQIRNFLDVPGVRETLQRAADLDPDNRPARFCCAETVREQAERASVPDSEFPAWVRSKLLDENLPARSRLINLMGTSYDGRDVGGFSRIGNDLAPVVLEIGQSDADPGVRAMAWDALYLGKADRAFLSTKAIPVLLNDLRISTDERVRASAARILFGFRDNAGVQEALLQAQSDASIRVRRAAEGAGNAPGSGE